MRRRRRNTTGSSNFGEIAAIWRGGCIIRARFLQKITDAYTREPATWRTCCSIRTSTRASKSAQDNWRKVVALAARHGIAAPAFMTALAYYDGYRSARLPANLLQAQRDYFGAHTYERVDQPRGKFFHLDWPDPKRPQHPPPPPFFFFFSSQGRHPMIVTQLESTPHALVSSGRGILAADESHPTLGKRFAALGIENTAESRRVYRQMMFTTPGLGEFISGIILFDDHPTGRPTTARRWWNFSASGGMIPGIKVNKGDGGAGRQPPARRSRKALTGSASAWAEYGELGARFTKWRAVITIGEGIPTPYCMKANGHALARFAAPVRRPDLVPIVKPEVLHGRRPHDRALRGRSQRPPSHTVFAALCRRSESCWRGCSSSRTWSSPARELSAAGQGVQEVARGRLLLSLRRTVPAAVPS